MSSIITNVADYKNTSVPDADTPGSRHCIAMVQYPAPLLTARATLYITASHEHRVNPTIMGILQLANSKTHGVATT